MRKPLFLHHSLICGLLMLGLSRAEDPKPVPPRITAMEPVILMAGYSGPMKLRGFQLKTTQQIQFADAPAIKVEIKDRKDAAQTPNTEKKDNGDSQVEFQITIPSDQPPGLLSFTVQTEAGTTDALKIELLAADQVADEKEPNGGFREAQLVEPNKRIRGNIQQDQDVDVYQFRGVAGQKFHAEVLSARSPSLLDSTLTLHDSKGILLAQNDDADSRDSLLDYTLPSDGLYFLTLTDALDHGGEWHAYQLQFNLTP